MKHILDQLDAVEAAVPAIQGRLDGSRIAIAGHSMGGHTAGMLLGAQLTDENGEKVNMIEPRFKAGLMLCAPGSGGSDLSENAAKNYSFLLHPSFAELTTQTLMVVGDHDINPFMTVRGPDWYVEPYLQSPGPKCLLSMTGGQHILGGISGYDAAEAGDENPERVAAVQRMTWAYLRSALYPQDTAWPDACAALTALDAVAHVQCK